MIGRNISFIVGQHDPELDEAIRHHKGRNGIVLEITAMHPSIGQEVLAIWFDRSPFLEDLAVNESIDLRVRCGLALTEAGPIAFILWWLPPIDKGGLPFVKEHILNPLHAGNRKTVRRLGGQKGLHVAMVGLGPRILGLHEFENDFGFGHLYSYMEAAAEKGWPGYDFDAALSAFEQTFEIRGLLYGRYPDLVVAGDGPNL
jgi:hypothetical protein